MSDEKRSARDVIAGALERTTGYSGDHATDLFVGDMRERGFVVVPREPTGEMKLAALNAWMGEGTHAAVWRAMLSVWERLSTNPDREGE